MIFTGTEEGTSLTGRKVSFVIDTGQKEVLAERESALVSTQKEMERMGNLTKKAMTALQTSAELVGQSWSNMDKIRTST